MEHRPSQNEEGKTRSSVLFQDFQNLQRIWTHPRVLRYNSDRYEINARKKKDALSEDEDEGSLKEFVDEDEDEEEGVASIPSSSSDSPISSDCESTSNESSKPKSVKKNTAVQLARRTRASNKCCEFQQAFEFIST